MYQVLARKYRPRNFNELVGQNHVSRALTSALERGRLHHAYLFTGTRGVGKTTIARILAKCLNCETGVTSTPCEVCATCKAVNEGRFIDLIEIDAASRTKVEDTRELLDNVPYAPTQGRFKVYLIDEVHMLSTHSFNALLKTLEEPPEHVKFLFATTDPQKLPITVISRCLQFTLRPLAVDEIMSHLGEILHKEQIAAEDDALWQIAESAQGSLRDALSLTDQAIAYGQGQVQAQDVKDMLGLIDRSIIYDLLLAIHQNQQIQVSKLLLQFRQQALDVSLVLDQLITTLHELALLQYLPDLALKYSAEINLRIKQLSQLVSAQDLQLYYQIACKGREELQLAVTQEQGFEMCILRLLAFRPLQADEILTSVNQAVSVPTSEPIVPAAAELAQVTDILFSADESDEAVDDIELVDEALTDIPVEEETSADMMLFDPAEGLVGLDEQPEWQDSAAEPAAFKELPDDSGLTLFDSLVSTPVLDEQQKPASSVDLNHQMQQAEVETIPAQPEPMLRGDEVSAEDIAENVKADQSQYNQRMPQDILLLQPELLEGAWTLEKWEYWLRHSELSPALQELAQQGVMSGEINGVSVFHVAPEYERMLSPLQGSLVDTLQQQWPETKFQVDYTDVAQTTPYQLQGQRKEKAHQRAAELLHTQPVIQSLLETFDGELQNIQLKLS